MGYQLSVPTEGFTEFEVYRHPYEDQVEVLIGTDQFIFEDLTRLKLWMGNAGVYRPFIERFVDLIWNFRRIHFDLKKQWLTIPTKQGHPLEQTMKDRPFYGLRAETTDRDPFDPLQDAKMG